MCYDFVLMDNNSIFVFNAIYFPKENILYEHNTDNQLLITWGNTNCGHTLCSCKT